MPLFEYHCRNCQETFEKLQRQPERESACPHCGKTAKRVISLFNGSAGSDVGCAGSTGSGFG